MTIRATLIFLGLLVGTAVSGQEVPEFNGVYVRLHSSELVELRGHQFLRAGILLSPGNGGSSSSYTPTLETWRTYEQRDFPRVVSGSFTQNVGFQVVDTSATSMVSFNDVQSIVIRGRGIGFQGIDGWTSLEAVERGFDNMAGVDLSTKVYFSPNECGTCDANASYFVKGQIGLPSSEFREKILDEFTVEYVPRNPVFGSGLMGDILGPGSNVPIVALQVVTYGGTYIFADK